MSSISRRDALVVVAAGSLPLASAKRTRSGQDFVDILRIPDLVRARVGSSYVTLSRAGQQFAAAGISVEVQPAADSAAVIVESPAGFASAIQVRWTGKVPRWRVLGDAWERSYGDLGWEGFAPERVLPWYFALSSGTITHCYGVGTGCHAFCFWQADDAGISLWIDLRNGGEPAQLGDRRLKAATVFTRKGRESESPFDAVRQFCKQLCAKPILPAQPVYGNNTWYYTYGNNFTASDVQVSAKQLAEVTQRERNRPFLVLDDGWQSGRHTAGPWEHGNEAFPDMPGLISAIRQQNVRPGLWLRPLATTASVPVAWCLQRAAADSPELRVLDPTVPEVIELVRADIARVRSWGVQLVKHDFSAFDLFGRWGFAMEAELTSRGWHFNDRSETNAEIVLRLYAAIREAAESALVLGCNVFSHLCAGLVEINRTGDDVSGKAFDRTRKMGVNTLAFRAPQHGTFYALDADCAPITKEIPWEQSRQWLQLLAQSGTATFASCDLGKVSQRERLELESNLRVAASADGSYEPVDWLETRNPTRWLLNGEELQFRWFDEGADPFTK